MSLFEDHVDFFFSSFSLRPSNLCPNVLSLDKATILNDCRSYKLDLRQIAQSTLNQIDKKKKKKKKNSDKFFFYIARMYPNSLWLLCYSAVRTSFLKI